MSKEKVTKESFIKLPLLNGNIWAGVSRSAVPWNIRKGDARLILKEFPSESYNCVVTSPPYYWLRDYEVDNQIGLEDTVTAYVEAIVEVMDEVKRVLKKDGTLFLNLGDTYYSGKGESQGVDQKSSKRRFGLRAVDKSGGLGIGLRPKTAIGIPWRVAIEMSTKGWILRSPIIWSRKHCLPESVKDRPRRSYEFVFLFVKNRNYYFNRQGLLNSKEEDVWTITARPKASDGIRTAPFPDELVQRCLDVGCPPEGLVLDPFAGSGTTLRVAISSGRPATGIDLSADFCNYTAHQLQKM